MFIKKYIGFFIIMFFPMLFVSALINFLFSLNAHDFIQINWLIVILLAIVLDALIIWIQIRKGKEKKSE